MNVGRAITAGMRADRRRDFHQLCWQYPHHYVLAAWLMWGWAIHGTSHLGMGGLNYPYWSRPRWDK